MRPPCLPPDTQDPEEKPFGGKTLADCVLLVERGLTNIRGTPPDDEQTRKLWLRFRLTIQDAAMKYADVLAWRRPFDPAPVHALRSHVHQAQELLPASADPRLRKWLETVPWTILNCNTPEELEAGLTDAIADVQSQA